MNNNHVFIEKLRSSGLRPTKQRIEICKLLFDRKDTFHFSISDLKNNLDGILEKTGIESVEVSDSSINDLQSTVEHIWQIHNKYLITEIKNGLEKLKLEKMPEIFCEPGRAIVAEAGSTIVKVILRKKQNIKIIFFRKVLI